ncbi:MAG: WhiB family transcriptional regulator [Acidimicrobiia bacterium]|nr:WhiB family transcriptional regulator [Acidimicrobiia bacterium]
MATPFTRMLAEADDRPWAAHAACRSADPDLFFGGEDDQVRSAVTICRGCPVLDDCRDWALDLRIPYGVWGGMTERERRRALRRSA